MTCIQQYWAVITITSNLGAEVGQNTFPILLKPAITSSLGKPVPQYYDWSITPSPEYCGWSQFVSQNAAAVCNTYKRILKLVTHLPQNTNIHPIIQRLIININATTLRMSITITVTPTPKYWDRLFHFCRGWGWNVLSRCQWSSGVPGAHGWDSQEDIESGSKKIHPHMVCQRGPLARHATAQKMVINITHNSSTIKLGEMT